jgi:hypothetical protein
MKARVQAVFEKFAAEQIGPALQDEALMGALLANIPAALAHLEDAVYSTVLGSDYARLAAFYALMSKLQHELVAVDASVWLVSVALSYSQAAIKTDFIELSRLFAKLTPAIKLDFKALVHGGDPLPVMRDRLSEENVGAVARLSSKIPCEGGFLSSSMVLY